MDKEIRIKYTHSLNCSETREFIKKSELIPCPHCGRLFCPSCLDWKDKDKACSSCRLCNSCNKSAKKTKDGLIGRCRKCLEKYCSKCWGKGDENYCEECGKNSENCGGCKDTFSSDELSDCSRCGKWFCDNDLWWTEEEGEERFCHSCFYKVLETRKQIGKVEVIKHE